MPSRRARPTAMVSMIWPLSRVLTPLVGSSRNRSLGFKRIGQRDVEQLALALREIRAPLPSRLAARPNWPSTASASSVTAWSRCASSRRCSGLALAREDRQRDVVERGQIVEQIHELEAARDAGLDALRHRRVRDVFALEQDLARTRPADSALMTLISEVLPAPFGPDQRDELALFDAEVDVVDRARSRRSSV